MPPNNIEDRYVRRNFSCPDRLFNIPFIWLDYFSLTVLAVQNRQCGTFLTQLGWSHCNKNPVLPADQVGVYQLPNWEKSDCSHNGSMLGCRYESNREVQAAAVLVA